MKIFISWSGTRSKKAALALRDWLPCVFQTATPFVSSEDLRKGKRWLTELTAELEQSSFGVLCLNKENMESPWILFEAGALSKAVNESYACTLLLDGLKSTEVTGPLSNFQHTIFEKADVRKLAGTINDALKEKKLREDVLNRVFEKFWPELEEGVQRSQKGDDIDPRSTRPDRDLLEEILTLSRFIARNTVPPDAEKSIESLKNKLGKLLYLDIKELELPAKTHAMLTSFGIENVGGLATRTASELGKLRGLKNAEINQIQEKLQALGLDLGMQFDHRIWSPLL